MNKTRAGAGSRGIGRQDNKEDQEKPVDEGFLAVSAGPWLLHHGQ